MNHTTIAMATVAAAIAATLIIGAIDLVPMEVNALGLNTNSGTPITQGSDGASTGTLMPNMNEGGQSQGPMSLRDPGAGPLSHVGVGNGPMEMISGVLNNLPLSKGNNK